MLLSSPPHPLMISINPFRSLPHLSSIARRYTWTVPVVVVLGLVNGALESIGIGLLVPLLGTVMANGTENQPGILRYLDSFAAGLDPNMRIVAIVATMLLFVLLKGIFQAASRIFIVSVDGKTGHDIRRALIDRMLSVGYPFYFVIDDSRLLNIISTESWRAGDAVRAYFTYVASLCTVLILGLGLVAIDWRLAVMVGMSATLLALLQSRLLKRLQTSSRKISASNQLLADRMLAMVLQPRLVRLFGGEAEERSRFDAASESVRRTILSVELMTAFIQPVTNMLYAVMLVATLVAAMQMGVSLPVIVAFMVLLNRVQPHMKSIESAQTTLAAVTDQVREVEWLLSPEGKPPAPEGDRPFDGLRDGIDFMNVDFGYPSQDNSLSLEGASFRITAGTSTALIGSSGSGKSTIVNLLCRLMEPTRGEIRVDGTRLSEIRMRDWISKIGVAGQDVALVDGTVADNIRYGNLALGDDEMEAIARLADAHDFVCAMPAGYATEVGFNGAGLSGGQRQRIGIARALARRPSLLILDEATNAVDGLSENAILRLLREVNHQMTILVVSHRPSTLALCSHGIAVEYGQIVETGPLAELQSYRRMFDPVRAAE